MGIPVAHRRPHVTGQRSAYAAKSAKKGGITTYTLPLPQTHIRHHGTSEWRRCKNGVLHAGSLLRRLYAGHLRSRYHRRPAESSPNDGQYPIPCGINLSVVRSRWGQHLGQKRTAGENDNLCKTKIHEILRFRGFLARREGFEPPAFWSVGCLGEKTKPFRLRFNLFTAICRTDIPMFPSGTACSCSNLGQKWVKISSQPFLKQECRSPEYPTRRECQYPHWH